MHKVIYPVLAWISLHPSPPDKPLDGLGANRHICDPPPPIDSVHFWHSLPTREIVDRPLSDPSPSSALRVVVRMPSGADRARSSHGAACMSRTVAETSLGQELCGGFSSAPQMDTWLRRQVQVRQGVVPRHAWA